MRPDESHQEPKNDRRKNCSSLEGLNFRNKYQHGSENNLVQTKAKFFNVRDKAIFMTPNMTCHRFGLSNHP